MVKGGQLGEFSKWLSEQLDVENKEILLRFMPSDKTLREDALHKEWTPSGHQLFRFFEEEKASDECHITKDAAANTHEVYQFLSNRVMTLLWKNKAIVSMPFSVANDEKEDLSSFLLPDLKHLSVADWADLYPCALACSLLGETGRAAVAVPASMLRLNRYEKARKLLLKTGLLRQVVYLRLEIRSLDEMALLIFSGTADRGQRVRFGKLEWPSLMVRRRAHAHGREVKLKLSNWEIVSADPDALLADGGRLDEGEARRQDSMKMMNLTLGRSFACDVIKSTFPTLFVEGGRAGEPDKEEETVEVRVLSPSDFNSEGLLAPYNPRSLKTNVRRITPKSLVGRDLREGDVLVARIGRQNDVYITPAVDPSSDVEAYVAGDNFIVLRPCCPGDAPLIRALLNGRTSRVQLDAAASSSQRLSPSDLMELLIPDVSCEEDLFDGAHEAIDEYYESHAALEKATKAYYHAQQRLNEVVEEATKRQRKRSQPTDSDESNGSAS